MAKKKVRAVNPVERPRIIKGMRIMNVKTSRRRTPYTMEEQRGHNLLEAVCVMDG